MAFAVLGSAFAYITKTLTGLSKWQILFGLGGAVLVVLVPITIIVVVGLLRQDLSALLEGCGWAVDARMRLTRGQRRFFTRTKPYPPGAEGAPLRPWQRAAVVLLALVGLVLSTVAAVRIGRDVLFLLNQGARQSAPPVPGRAGADRAPPDARPLR